MITYAMKDIDWTSKIIKLFDKLFYVIQQNETNLHKPMVCYEIRF